MAIEKEDALIWESYLEESMSLFDDISEKYDYYKSYNSFKDLIQDLQRWLRERKYTFDKDSRKDLNDFLNDVLEISETGFEGFLNTDRRGVRTFKESFRTKPKKGEEFNIEITFKIPPEWMEDHEHKDGVFILKIY